MTEQKRQGADADAPKEVAEVVAFLASEESSGLNGEAITVALGSLS
jgi:NAD(P)-dependent dehydrogenase (short-subunit alcohol dehydrogenase family)